MSVVVSGHLATEHKVELTIKQWSDKAGLEAGKLLRSLKLKAD